MSNLIGKPSWAKNNIKRCDATHQDLPIGFFQSYEEKTNELGEVARFGRRKTREEAIIDLISSVNSFLTEH